MVRVWQQSGRLWLSHRDYVGLSPSGFPGASSLPKQGFGRNLAARENAMVIGFLRTLSKPPAPSCSAGFHPAVSQGFQPARLPEFRAGPDHRGTCRLEIGDQPRKFSGYTGWKPALHWSRLRGAKFYANNRVFLTTTGNEQPVTTPKCPGGLRIELSDFLLL